MFLKESRCWALPRFHNEHNMPCSRHHSSAWNLKPGMTLIESNRMESNQMEPNQIKWIRIESVADPDQHKILRRMANVVFLQGNRKGRSSFRFVFGIICFQRQCWRRKGQQGSQSHRVDEFHSTVGDFGTFVDLGQSLYRCDVVVVLVVLFGVDVGGGGVVVLPFGLLLLVFLLLPRLWRPGCCCRCLRVVPWFRSNHRCCLWRAQQLQRRSGSRSNTCATRTTHHRDAPGRRRRTEVAVVVFVVPDPFRFEGRDVSLRVTTGTNHKGAGVGAASPHGKLQGVI